MMRCKVHNAPFKTNTSRWCKGSNPTDVCEAAPAPSEPEAPRMLPPTAMFMLGSRADVPGWISFLSIAQDEGFGFHQPGDNDLDEERWKEIAEIRMSALVSAFDMWRERIDLLS